MAFNLEAINYNINKNKNLYSNKKKIEVSPAPDVWKYVGEIKELVPHGKGKITDWAGSGYDYDGDFINGKATGKGKENLNLGSYEGDFIDNVRHGKGTFNFYDGSKYIGDWKKDYRDGKGTYIWPDGFKLEGKWSKDFFVGLYWGNDTLFPATRKNWLNLCHVLHLTSNTPSTDKLFGAAQGEEKVNPKISFEGNYFKYIDFNEKK